MTLGPFQSCQIPVRPRSRSRPGALSNRGDEPGREPHMAGFVIMTTHPITRSRLPVYPCPQSAGRWHPITPIDNPLPKQDRPAHTEASLCQGAISKAVPGARGRASGVAGGGVVGLVVGSGSDLSEEPAVQDVEPVTLDFVSFLIVLPGLPITARVGGRRR
jgi:hypothetical protein